ncbi:L2 minor capsid protein [Bos taurus papillomavirus 31]|nr:L2 minor capsid protein [Bos taurus papillomavirus 31]
MSMSRRRSKRDSAGNIYATCKANNNCPPDVINKIEGNTVADKILKWLSGLVYFGGLGIGTGRGTGGTSGYTPLGGRGVTTGAGTRVVRPSLPVEPIGPGEVGITIGESVPEGTLPDITVSGPTEVTVEQPDLTITEAQPTDPSVFQPAGESDTIGEEIELEVLRPEQSGDNLITDDNPGLEVPAPTIDVTETTFTEVPRSIPSRQGYSSSVTDASFNASVAQPSATRPYIVDGTIGGVHVGGGEQYDLEVLGQRFEEIPLEELPSTSTPKEQAPPRTTRRLANKFYHRFFKQIDTGSISFTDVPEGGSYVFQNPAFDPDGLVNTMPEQVTTRRLGDIEVGRGPTGHVRVSRLGRLPGMTTRSGQELGQFAHLYKDISSIVELNNSESIIFDNTILTINDTTAPENIELQTFTAEGGIEELSPEEEYDFGSSRLRLLHFDVDITDPEAADLESPRKVFAAYDSTSYETTASAGNQPVKIPVQPLNPDTVIIVDYYLFGADYDLHPSLFGRKRKRKYIF